MREGGQLFIPSSTQLSCLSFGTSKRTSNVSQHSKIVKKKKTDQVKKAGGKKGKRKVDVVDVHF